MVGTVQHNALTTTNLHEVKGASSATAGQVLRGTGSQTATFESPAQCSKTNAIGSVTTTLTVNTDLGDIHTATLGGNATASFTNPEASCAFILILTQDGTGSRTVTWPAAVKWAGGTTPTLTTTAAKKDIFSFFTPDSGTNWYGFVCGQNFS